MWKLLAAVPLALSLFNPTFAIAQEAPANQKSLPEQTVDAFNGVFGVHPKARSNHAKGVLLEGTFTPSASAASVSKAAHLQKQKTPIPLTVRFSAGSGLPTVPDTAEMPRGMAVKFTLADGSQTDIVVLSFNGFPVATSEELRDFFLALGASGPDAPKPTALDKFLASHPTANAFAEAPKPPPVSYARLPYCGINRSKCSNPNALATFGRYQRRPDGGGPA